MALPKLSTVVYDLELPLSKKKIQFRPFLVKEQKALLMAMESDDKQAIQSNIKNILKNCTLTSGINVDKLPVVDIEYYFLNLRARSVGEVVENKYRCDHVVDEKNCGNIMQTSVNLLDLKVEGLVEGNDIIQLTPQISMKLKYPEFSVVERVSNITEASQIAFEMVVDSIEYIYDGEQFYHAHEVDRKELMEFVESLDTRQFSMIEEFFNSIPKIKKKIELKCSKCGHDHSFEVEGLESFFG